MMVPRAQMARDAQGGRPHDEEWSEIPEEELQVQRMMREMKVRPPQPLLPPSTADAAPGPERTPHCQLTTLCPPLPPPLPSSSSSSSSAARGVQGSGMPGMSMYSRDELMEQMAGMGDEDGGGSPPFLPYP